MPGPVLHSGAIATCPHAGPLTIIASSARVQVSGMPAGLLTDAGQVAGCAFVVGVKPQPCVTTKWIAAATRVVSNGVPLLINPPVAVCLSADQIPAGPPIIMSSQTRVIAT